MADLKSWLAQGANPDDELNNAIVADDIDRVRYLLGHGAHLDAVDGEGYPPLVNASRFGFIAGGHLSDRAQGKPQSGRSQRLDAAHVCRVGRPAGLGQNAARARRETGRRRITTA